MARKEQQIPQYVFEARSFLQTVCKPASCGNLMETPKNIRCIAKDLKDIAADFNNTGRCELGMIQNKRKIIPLPVT